jgi:hypothetical protein
VPQAVKAAAQSTEQGATADAIETGGVTWRVYWKYCGAAGGMWALLAILVTNVLLHGCMLGFDYYTAMATSTMGMPAAQTVHTVLRAVSRRICACLRRLVNCK